MRSSLIIVAILALAVRSWAGDLKISPLFGDNACVQAGRPVAIWGWGDPGNKVSIDLAGSSVEAEADKSGRWQAKLGPVKAGGPYVLTVKSGEQTVESKNILAGEVWLASGQSNMFWPLYKAQDGEAEIASAQNDKIRFFRCEIEPSFQPIPEPKGKWEICAPETAREFSGAAYYFGKSLQKELGVPVGLIQTALGGTPIEGWLPPDLWKESADFERIRKVQDDLADDHMRKTYERLLKGWERKGSPAGKRPPEPDYGGVDQNDASVCYNVGIAPVAPYTIAGFLWYQGEWNASRAADYGKLLEALVSRWRALWGEGDLPFYVVQLPSVGDKLATDPAETKSHWSALREKQATVLKMPNTGLVVTMDVGGELHPPYKQQVGERLARIALANAYKRDIVFSGPTLVKAQAEGKSIAVSFENAAGLVLKPIEGRTGFAIAGDDKVYHAAEARVEGEKIELSSPKVPEPKYVRYLWAQNPAVTVFNEAGLPAAPFRTELWDDFAVEAYEKGAK